MKRLFLILMVVLVMLVTGCSVADPLTEDIYSDADVYANNVYAAGGVFVGGSPVSGGESEKVVVTTNSISNSTTTLQNATGLTFTANANGTYIIECFLVWDSSNGSAANTVVNTGIKLSASVTGSPTITSGYFSAADSDDIELAVVQAAVYAMMEDNCISTLPVPVSTIPTNNMNAFPDVSIAGNDKLKDCLNNDYIPPFDKNGYILWQHDRIADMSDTIGLVNYVTAEYTQNCYIANSDGLVKNPGFANEYSYVYDDVEWSINTSYNANNGVIIIPASAFSTGNTGILHAVLKTGSSSTWQLKFAAETTGTITMKAGSVLRYRKVA